MPRFPIDRSTNFIVEQESWTVVEYDHTSVPGVIYLSLTEGKINSIYDDIENNIADLDKLADYQLEMPEITQIFHLGDHITPVFTLTKNGTPCDEPVELVTSNKQVVREINGELIAVGRGEVTIFARLVNYPSIQTSIDIVVGDEEQQFSAYLEGQDSIRLDRMATYNLIGTSEITSTVDFALNNTSYAKIISINNNSCIVEANDKNLLGEIVLTATYNNIDYTKTIKIIPVW